MTPESDQLEELRKSMGFPSSAPYADCLKLCRRMERKVHELEKELAKIKENL